MAISIETLAAPTLVSIGDSDTAGSLVPGQTWYFRVVAIKGFGNNGYIDSPWMAETSWTVGAGKSSIAISWNVVAGANRYYVLATSISGNYDETANHCIGWEVIPTSLTWTGSYGLGPQFWYRPSGVPNIIVEGGSAGTPLTFDDIYTADVAGGWNRVDRQRVKGSGAEPYVEYGGGTPRPQLKNSYVVDASLMFGSTADCYFRQYNADILLLGALRTSNTYTKLFQLGSRSGTAMGAQGCELRVRGTCDIDLCGVCNIYASSLISEGSQNATWQRATTIGVWWPHTWRANALSTNASASVAIVTSQIYGGWTLFTRNEAGIDLYNLVIGLYTGIRIAIGAVLSDDRITQISFGAAISRDNNGAGAMTFRRCSSLHYSRGDISWVRSAAVGADTIFVDCIFQSQGQTDNDPFFNVCYHYSMIYPGKLIFKHEFDPIFVNTLGSVISGATVLLTDKDGATIISDITNGSGKLTGGAVEVIRRNIVASPSHAAARNFVYLSWMIAQGYLIEDVRNPHTLRVHKYGFVDYEVTMNIEAKTTGSIIIPADSWQTKTEEEAAAIQATAQS